ncbi:MAG: SseB family protein [Actinomycetota bacterium]|nr:SseB family protein [Actinomycetota bacterium]
MSGHLNPGGQQFRDDNGAADPRVRKALAAYVAGEGSEQAALSALSAARLLVPVVAILADGSAPGGAHGDKNSEMVLPTLIGQDGRPAVLAFTCLDALTRWRPNARPVPAEADRVWRAAVADGCAVVIDVAGPVPLAVEGARLDALAGGQPVPPPHEDPDVRAAVEAALAAEPTIAGFSLTASSTDGTDLAIRLSLAVRDWEPVVDRAASSIAARLAGRLRRGIEFSVAAAPR